MTTRFAFVGFRHPHIYDMFERCRRRDDVEVVACCEEDAATRQALAVENRIEVTHHNFAGMLNEVECDVVAVGDYYGKRGSLIVEALKADRHVISDKPMCISLEELDAIEQVAREKQRVVGCMLDMRDSAVFLGLRKLIRNGDIGTVHAVSFGGQHALNFGMRPGWYFEKGKHGGTLNDIAVHAVDGIRWITGLTWAMVDAARCWNAMLPQLPHFEECAQAMCRLEGGAGVICDVSYLSPNSFQFSLPLYWRFTFWGDGGVVEAGYNSTTITLYKNGEKTVHKVALPEAMPGGYLDAFLSEIRGQTENLHLTSSEALQASRTALKIQEAADRQLCRAPLAERLDG